MSNRVVIIVEGGIADYINDAGVEVLLIDLDAINSGDELFPTDIKRFEDLLPTWTEDYMPVNI